METSLKTGFAQVFSCCPKNLSCPKFGGAAAPLAPPARTPVRSIEENSQTWPKILFGPQKFIQGRDISHISLIGFWFSH